MGWSDHSSIDALTEKGVTPTSFDRREIDELSQNPTLQEIRYCSGAKTPEQMKTKQIALIPMATQRVTLRCGPCLP